MLADTHCHLDFDLFTPDREAVIARARQAGVDRILNPGIDLESSRAALELAEKYDIVYAAVGVHPNESTTWDGDTLRTLRELASHPKVVAIGEIGLDYYRDRAPRDLQQKVFQEQLMLAAELSLPVVIHNRQASDDVMEILKEWQVELMGANVLLAEHPGVLHSFSASEQAAHEAIGLNFYIGITGPVTFKNAPDLQQLVAHIPLDRLLIETDAPFLTPHPHRGERNEPAYVRFVAEKIAELHNLPVEMVSNSTSINAGRLFHWKVIS